MKIIWNPIIRRYWTVFIICNWSFVGHALGDWQLSASNKVSGSASPSANAVITKIRTNEARMDLSPATSVLSFVDRGEQIQLNHRAKTYIRQVVADAPIHSSTTTAPLLSSEQTVFNGQPAELFSWTNGLESGRTWVAQTSRFPNLPKDFSSNASQSSSFPNVAVGSSFGSNSIVVGTEYTTTVPLPEPLPTDMGALQVGTTNLVVTIASTLLSITETNFADSDFEIPADYRDVTGQPQNVSLPGPEIFGDRSIGHRNMEGLRKEFEKGRPVLVQPPIRPKP